MISKTVNRYLIFNSFTEMLSKVGFIQEFQKYTRALMYQNSENQTTNISHIISLKHSF